MRKLLLLLIVNFQLIKASEHVTKSNRKAVQAIVALSIGDVDVNPDDHLNILGQVTDWNVVIGYKFKERYLNTCPLVAAGLHKKDGLFLTILNDPKTNVNFTDHEDKTPLHLLIELGDKEEDKEKSSIVSRLVDHEKTNLEARTTRGLTPLMVAAQHSKQNAFFSLYSARANTKAVDSFGKSVAQYAQRSGILLEGFYHAIFGFSTPSWQPWPMTDEELNALSREYSPPINLGPSRSRNFLYYDSSSSDESDSENHDLITFEQATPEHRQRPDSPFVTLQGTQINVAHIAWEVIAPSPLQQAIVITKGNTANTNDGADQDEISMNSFKEVEDDTINS